MGTANVAGATRRPRHNVVWVPSQNGLLPVRLQPHSQTLPIFSALKPIGVKAVSLCEPSQNGCLPLRPQAHQKYYLPSSTLTS